MKLNKISNNNKKKCIDDINKNGYTTIRNLIPKKIIQKYLNLTKKIYSKKNGTSKHTPRVWNTAKVVHNLQNKDLSFLKIIQNEIFDEILKKK